MMRKLLLIFIPLFVGLSLLLATPSVKALDIFDKACTGSGTNSTLCKDTSVNKNPITGKNGILYKASVIISLITGSVAVIMMIAGGFMIVSSSGDSGKVASGRKTVIYAAVGLLVIASGQTIIVFVINSLD